MKPFLKTLSLALSLAVGAVTLSGCPKQPPAPTAISSRKTDSEQNFRLAGGYLQGHKVLYDEGWFFVTSTKKTLEYAKENSIKASSGSMKRIAKAVVKRTGELGGNVSDDLKDSYDKALRILEGGTTLTVIEAAGTMELMGDEFDYSKQAFEEACEVFVKGHIHLVKRTADDFHDIVSLPGNYFGDLKSDFSNIYDLSAQANKSVSDKIALSWDRSFDEAAGAFRKEYDQSGKRGNSLTALGDILSGYLKAFYAGVAKPSAKSIVEGSAKGANSLVFLPCAATAVVVGRTIEATGLTLYYTGKTGYHVVSPSLESGFLAGLSLLSMASVPVTAAGGAGLCAVNQVAFTAAAPVVGAGKALGDTAADTGKYVALVSHDVSVNSSHVMINHVKTGVALGYNALTAIPAHLFLGTLDTAVFLAYDGPRLVVAVARGEIKPGSGSETFSIGNLPTGSVVDLDKLEKEKGVKVTIVTDDPVIINNVIENMPKDLGGGHE
jgi:hypothetical protein